MKLMLLTALLLGGISSYAQSNSQVVMICDVSETKGEQTSTSTINLVATDDPHGDMQIFNLKLFPTYSALISNLNGFAVIHIYDTESGYAFTSHADVTGSGTTFYQLYLPAKNSHDINAVQVVCGRPELRVPASE